jgi:MOSC domain-containing protein YiiM
METERPLLNSALDQEPGRIVSVNVSSVRTVAFHDRPVTTGIYKLPGTGRIRAAGVNLKGDDQADRVNHGGEHKALYAYASEDYEWYSEHVKRMFQSGDFGENLTTQGLDLTHAIIGERWKVGSVEVEVSEPRLPCYKLGIKVEDPRFPAVFAKALRPGAYLRIKQEGELGQGDAVQVLFRPDHGVTIRLVAEAYLFDHARRPELRAAPQLRSVWYE